MEAPRPDGLDVVRDVDGLAIRFGWFKPQVVFMVFFCIFWDGFLWFWYRQAFARHEGPTSPMMWFPLLHVAVGVGLTYSTLAGLVNRTEVRARSDALSIRHGPLPWIGNRDVPVTELQQLFREEKTTTRRGTSSTTSDLSAIASDNRKILLLRGVPPDVALFVEQEIEKALGITNRRVAGEMPK